MAPETALLSSSYEPCLTLIVNDTLFDENVVLVDLILKLELELVTVQALTILMPLRSSQIVPVVLND